MKRRHFSRLLGPVVSALLGSALVWPHSAAAWDMRFDLGGLSGSYSDSQLRDSATGTDLFLRADYFDQYGFSLGLNNSVITFTDGSETQQQTWFASGRSKFYLQSGVVTARLDGYWVGGSDQEPVGVVMPQLSVADYDESYLLDIGYAYSRYNPSLQVHQWTPSLGVGFNDRYDWLQLRGYLISYSEPRQAQGRGSTQAVELKWSHWFSEQSLLVPKRLQFTKVFGERIYAVDPDLAAVYNLSDIDRGMVSLSGVWQLDSQWELLLAVGRQNSTNSEISNDYLNDYIYMDIAYVW